MYIQEFYEAVYEVWEEVRGERKIKRTPNMFNIYFTSQSGQPFPCYYKGDFVTSTQDIFFFFFFFFVLLISKITPLRKGGTSLLVLWRAGWCSFS
jgi:hypothetical protein